jgi:predicted O-methyltransferase YrrM
MYVHQSRGMGNVLPEDGRLLRMLAETLGARHVVELGTANGYSALWFCLALRSTGGKLTTHEIDPKRIALAQENFRRAGVEELVTLVEGDAHGTIQRLAGPIDLLLLDAEKEGFPDYLTKLLPRLRPGGLILAHDSSGQAHLMHDYFQAITAHPDLETVFVDASRWGLCITRKMR